MARSPGPENRRDWLDEKGLKTAWKRVREAMLYVHAYLVLATALLMSLISIVGARSWKARGVYTACALVLALFSCLLVLIDREAQSDAFKGVYNDTPDYLRSNLVGATNVDIRAPDGFTLLMVAAQWNRVQNAKYLLARGANKRLRNPAGETAADIARRIGHVDLANLLEP
jgi:hypothetical protein